MAKKRVKVMADPALVAEARALGLNLSKVFEETLRKITEANQPNPGPSLDDLIRATPKSVRARSSRKRR